MLRRVPFIKKLRFLAALTWLLVKMEYTDFWLLIFNFQKLQYAPIVVKALLNLARARMGYFSVVQMTRSSAKRALETFKKLGRSLIKMRNNVQLRAEPWGSPSSRVKFQEVVPTLAVCMVLLNKKAWRQLNIFPCMPMLLILIRRPFLQTRS